MTTSAYDAIADWYDESIRLGTLLSASDLVASALFDTIGDIKGRDICDLACGQGDMARQLARRGARVVGVDLSQKLLDIARREEESEPLDITYLHEDAQSLKSIVCEQFDGVVCNMALMDIPDLAATAHNTQRFLRPKGWFITSITHPCFQIPPNHNYYEEGFWRSDNPDGVRGQVGAYHRTLSAYLNAFGQAGLLLERMTEPLLPNRELPPVLVAQCRKI
jgi:2-polyprenyl-3-methyl-5-hydroxy-6-metoxy-1,4-benzoquinol methylase